MSQLLAGAGSELQFRGAEILLEALFRHQCSPFSALALLCAPRSVLCGCFSGLCLGLYLPRTLHHLCPLSDPHKVKAQRVQAIMEVVF